MVAIVCFQRGVDYVNSHFVFTRQIVSRAQVSCTGVYDYLSVHVLDASWVCSHHMPVV